MPIDYVANIRTKDTPELLNMLTSLSNGVRIPGWPPGIAFEHIVIRAFEIENAIVTWPFKVRQGRRILEQIDGAIYCDGLSCLVESKDYSSAINVEPIAKLRNQLSRRPVGTLGIVFSRTDFTEPSKILAGIHRVRTITHKWHHAAGFNDQVQVCCRRRHT
jgi:hypothetical protein